MEIETNSTTIAAKFIYGRFMDGKGAQVITENGAKFWFAPSNLFCDDQFGVFVSCSKGGGVVFSSPERVNRFACVRARFPLWAGKYVVEVLKELQTLVQNEKVKSDLIIEAECLTLK